MATKRLPPIPKAAFSHIGPVSVVLVPGLEEKKDAFGYWDHKHRVIEIDPDMPLAAQWQTFFHEQVHVWLWDGGVGLSDADEERIADVIGTALAAWLRA